MLAWQLLIFPSILNQHYRDKPEELLSVFPLGRKWRCQSIRLLGFMSFISLYIACLGRREWAGLKFVTVESTTFWLLFIVLSDAKLGAEESRNSGIVMNMTLKGNSALWFLQNEIRTVLQKLQADLHFLLRKLIMNPTYFLAGLAFSSEWVTDDYCECFKADWYWLLLMLAQPMIFNGEFQS